MQSAIPAKSIKADSNTSVETLYILFGKIWDEEEGVLSDWNERYIIIKIPKKGDISNSSNDTEIMLLQVPGKVFYRIILTTKRVSDKTDPTDQVVILLFIVQ